MSRISYWWLSFCDTERPVGQQFTGVAIVRGGSLESAVIVAHVLGCNPGGEVTGFEIPDPLPEGAPAITDDVIGRLMGMDELVRRGFLKQKVAE